MPFLRKFIHGKVRIDRQAQIVVMGSEAKAI
jgi:hypothetical protein